jgi:glycosyltransferase involved in cell wall biosynthesis
MQKKKLLIATDSFLPRWDGIARFLNEIISKISNNFDIIVLAPEYEGKRPEIENVEIIRWPLYKFQVADIYPAKLRFKSLKDIVKRADIIWTQTIGPIGSNAILYGRKFNKTVIANIHSLEWELVSESVAKNFFTKSLIQFFIKKIAKYLYNKCDLLIVPSKEIAKILGWIGIKTVKVIIYLGVDINKFRPVEDKTRIREQLNLAPDKKIIGFTGRIGREKDLITIYRAFVSLSKKRDDILLLIVGEGVVELKKMLKQKENIILTGAVDNIVPYLQSMDIYVLPSLTETTSLSTMEAMACGLAVISTKVGFVKHYIKNKENGLFFPMKNSFVLMLKLEYLLNNERIRNKLGMNARKTIVERYTWDKTVEKINKVLSGY